MTTQAPQTGSSRDDTPEIIRWRYRQDQKVKTYEQNRYGNIAKSLSHFMDCDAIDGFLRRHAQGRELTALDLACGTGRLSRTLARPGLRIISSDFSETMLAEAAKNAAGAGVSLRIARADGFKLPFRDGAFDAIFTFRFLRHFKTPDRLQLYHEIGRILKPGGVLVFDVINAAVDVDVTKRKVWDEPFTGEQIQQELTAQGFTLEARIAGNIVRDPLFLLLKKWSLIRLGLWYGRRIRGQARHVDAATSWVVCARKT